MCVLVRVRVCMQVSRLSGLCECFLTLPRKLSVAIFFSLKCSVPFLLTLTSFSLGKLQCEPTIAVSRNNLWIKLRKLKVVEQKKP